MFARALNVITLLSVSSIALVAASPAPIDPIQANVIAMNNNMGCTGVHGCAGVNGTINVDTAESGASLASTMSTSLVGLAAAAALIGLA